MVSLIQNVMEFLGTINGQHTVVFRREFAVVVYNRPPSLT